MHIGSLELKNNVLAAPMAGVTDKAFRIIIREMGCALTFTEMVSAKALSYGSRRTHSLLDLTSEHFPVGVQIFGSEPEIMAEGARIAAEAGAAIIDINMGCPTPKIVKNGEGSALMRDLNLAFQIARAVVDAVRVPVTTKIRKGWDEAHVNAVELARRLEDAGVAAVTVHGRTREQFYSGTADWQIIQAVKQAVKIPVTGNGDIKTPMDAAEMIKQTGCDGVMIARGAMGNPWLFERTVTFFEQGLLPPAPSTEQKLRTARRHLDLAIRFKGERRAFTEMRKHLAWYVKGLTGAARLREAIFKVEDLQGLFRLLGEIESGCG